MYKTIQITSIILTLLSLVLYFLIYYFQFKPSASAFIERENNFLSKILKKIIGKDSKFNTYIITTIVLCVTFCLGMIGSIESTYHLNNVIFTTTSRLWFYIGLLSFVSLGSLVLSLWVGKRKDAIHNELLKKYLHLFTTIVGFIILFCVSCIVEGCVGIIKYPLNKNLIAWTSGGEIKLRVTYYAIFIITGALLALWIATRKFMKLGYRRNILESLFYVAFPFGIIGARIWYVIAEWNKSFAGNSFWDVFKIWDGGLAIQGGIIVGALAGVLFMRKYRKNINIFMAVDLIVPGILIAQAIGRMGNFVNFEVYGAEVSRASWGILPNWILNQMQVTQADPSRIYVPLFLVEAIVNVVGYYVLTYFVGEFLRKKKITIYGDVGFGYLIWYGLTRIVMEPLRNGNFIMGTKVQASRLMAIAFVIVGVLAIVCTHILNIKHKEWFINKPITPEDAGIESVSNNEK